MQDDREDRIRRLAYQRWEAEGFPEGQADRHWREAEELVAESEAAGAGSDVQPVNVEAGDEPDVVQSPLPGERRSGAGGRAARTGR